MKKLLILGNFKMNKTFLETLQYLEQFNKIYKKALKAEAKEALKENIYGIAYPFTNIAASVIVKNKNLKVCAQDVSDHEEGAFTGEISARMLKDLDVSYCLVGHAERRKLHHDTNQQLNLKVRMLLEQGITPVVCLGETLEQRQAGKSREVVEKQLHEILEGVEPTKVVIGYEPIWAIGKGGPATAKDINEMCFHIHDILNADVTVLYGGGVNHNNVEEIAKLEHVDGFLLGGASLDPEEFLKLISTHVEK